jgi:hypothetical protein
MLKGGKGEIFLASLRRCAINKLGVLKVQEYPVLR